MLNDEVLKCRGEFLPYRYDIELKDGKLVYTGDDLIKENVNYKTLEQAIQGALMCVYDRETEKIREKKNRDSWTTDKKTSLNKQESRFSLETN